VLIYIALFILSNKIDALITDARQLVQELYCGHGKEFVVSVSEGCWCFVLSACSSVFLHSSIVQCQPRKRLSPKKIIV